MWKLFEDFYYEHLLKYLIIGLLLFAFVAVAITNFPVFLCLVFVIGICWIAIPIGKYHEMNYQEYHYYYDDNIIGVFKRNIFKDVSLIAAHVSIMGFIIGTKGLDYATELTNRGFTSWSIYEKLTRKFELLEVFSIFDLPKTILYITDFLANMVIVESGNKRYTLIDGNYIFGLVLVSLFVAIICFARGIHNNDEGLKGIIIDYLVFGHINLLAIPFLFVGVLFGGIIVIPIVLLACMSSESSDSNSSYDASVDTNEHSFSRVYYRYRDTAEQRYYLYSHGDDYAYLKDEDGNQIYCYCYDDNGMLSDNEGNLYTPG